MSTFLYDKITYKPARAHIIYTPVDAVHTRSATQCPSIPKPSRTNALPELAMARELESRVRTLNSALNRQLSLMAR